VTVHTHAARLFDTREGFDPVDFAEVGLPIFRLTVEAATLARQDMATIHEFVLGAIVLGETQTMPIARLLGLTEDDIREALEFLQDEKSVDVVVDTEHFQVTELGSERLRSGERIPRTETLVFDFDGIRRRPLKLATENLLRPKELAWISTHGN
jgi:hypothetical protein